jgi:hypothetical protein
MNFEYRSLLPAEFAPSSRVWVYQSSRLFSLAEAFELEEKINAFCAQWTAHGDEVRSYGNLFFGQFIVLMADETRTHVSGCSTDSSVRFIKQLGEEYQVDFFNRTQLAFLRNEKIEMIPMAQLAYAVEHGYVNADTLFFNNLVQTKSELENNWIIPVKESWLARKLPVVNPPPAPSLKGGEYS